MVNPLTASRWRTSTTPSADSRKEEAGKPVDASGDYQGPDGSTVVFNGARDLATYLAASEEVHNAFVEKLFHQVVQQPILAYGPGRHAELRRSFAKNGYRIRDLMVEIVASTALGPEPSKPTASVAWASGRGLAPEPKAEVPVPFSPAQSAGRRKGDRHLRCAAEPVPGRRRRSQAPDLSRRTDRTHRPGGLTVAQPIRSRREFLRDLGLGAASLPFLLNLPSLAFANNQGSRKKRLVVMFSPDGIVPASFWPDEEGATFTLKESLKPLEPFKDRMLTLRGVCDKIRGDGDGHMRGIGCLLTGIELFPGNIQGGSDTPAGWASGLSIDQEIRNHLQKSPASRTRFGSLEFGVMVPDRADTWTRMVYAGPNKPIAPIDDPYQMFNKLLYGRLEGPRGAQEHPRRRAEGTTSSGSARSSAAEDRHLLEEHATFVREMEQELKSSEGCGSSATPFPRSSRACAATTTTCRASARCKST